MAAQRVTCGNCGNQEPAGMRFCGRCGSRMQFPAPTSGRPPTMGFPPAGIPAPEPRTNLLQSPLIIAVVLVALVAVVVGVVLLSAGGDGGNRGTNARRGGDASGDFHTPAPPTPLPGATPLSIAAPPTLLPPTPTPEPPPPTPTPEPPPMPQPPMPQPAPMPQPQPPPQPQPQPSAPPPPSPQAQPQVPAPKNSALVGLTISGGHGSTHRIGTNVQLCYRAQTGVWVRVYDTRTPGTLLFPEGIDDGGGACITGIIDPPAGIDTVRIDAYFANGNTRGAFRDYATISIRVAN